MLQSKRDLALALGADAVVDAGSKIWPGWSEPNSGKARTWSSIACHTRPPARGDQDRHQRGTVVVLGGPRRSRRRPARCPGVPDTRPRSSHLSLGRLDDAIEIIGGDDFDAERFITALPAPQSGGGFAPSPPVASQDPRRSRPKRRLTPPSAGHLTPPSSGRMNVLVA